MCELLTRPGRLTCVPKGIVSTNGTLKSTRMSTFSPLRLTSVMESLDERDMVMLLFGRGERAEGVDGRSSRAARKTPKMTGIRYEMVERSRAAFINRWGWSRKHGQLCVSSDDVKQAVVKHDVTHTIAMFGRTRELLVVKRPRNAGRSMHVGAKESDFMRVSSYREALTSC